MKLSPKVRWFIDWRILIHYRRAKYYAEWRILRKLADAFVYWYLSRCLLNETNDPASGRFVKMYLSYTDYSAAGEGVFQRIMGGPSAVEIARRNGSG